VSALLNSTAPKDDDAEVIDVPSSAITLRPVALVPMETGLAAYESPNDEKPQDVRELEAKVAALRFLKEFPQSTNDEIATLLSRFDLDREHDDLHADDDLNAMTDEEAAQWFAAAPSAQMLEHVQRIAERDYERVHQGEDWPEVAERKQRERGAQRQRNAEAAARVAEMQREPVITEPEPQTEAPKHEPVPWDEWERVVTANNDLRVQLDNVATGAGYSRIQRAMDFEVWDMLTAAGKTITATDRLVALTRLRDTNAKTRETFTSREHIAARAGLNEKTVKRSDEALEAAGILKLVSAPLVPGRGRGFRYRFARSDGGTAYHQKGTK